MRNEEPKEGIVGIVVSEPIGEALVRGTEGIPFGQFSRSFAL